MYKQPPLFLDILHSTTYTNLTIYVNHLDFYIQMVDKKSSVNLHCVSIEIIKNNKIPFRCN